MPWWPRDFRSSTLTWPLLAKGVYRELLDAQWDCGSLPEDPDRLQLLVGATAEEWRKAWPLVEPKFPIVDGARRNQRLEEHRRDALARHKSAQEKAVRAAAARYSPRHPEEGGVQ